jgi:hypothetical protein
MPSPNVSPCVCLRSAFNLFSQLPEFYKIFVGLTFIGDSSLPLFNIIECNNSMRDVQSRGVGASLITGH